MPDDAPAGQLRENASLRDLARGEHGRAHRFAGFVFRVSFFRAGDRCADHGILRAADGALLLS